MSGDTQAKKRKDKKRKKDDEDTVKETTVHAPKQPSAGAAQAAKEPGDVQMHIQSDHGTGGHWCAKVVFFILLAGLGALIGLIIMENQGVSNEDTPLSESRYSEFFNGWVDENRQDDHHHDEVLAAINSLDDHDDEGDAHHAVEDHDGGEDDGHDQDGDDDDHDDGAPYAEEEDHDDDEDGTEVQDDDEDEGPASKLDDDEVEEIYTQQEAAEQQQAAADDDDDGDDDGQDDDDEDDDAVLTNSKTELEDDNDDNDDEQDENDDDNDENNDDENAAAEQDDDDENEEDNNKNVDSEEEPAGNADDDDDNQNELANEDDDDDQDDTPFDEVKRSNALNDNANRNVPTINEDTVQTSVPEPERNQVPVTTTVPSTEGAVTGDTLKDQMDELVRNYNKLAESLDVPKVEEVVDFPDTIAAQDANDDGDEEEILEVTRGSQPANDDDDDDVDDDDAAFSELVDNDGGEEEYLEKLRAEQQRRAAAEAERRAAAEPEEETSQIPSPPVERVHEHHLPKLVVPPAGTSPGRARTPSPSGQRAARERHVEFLLPERDQQPEFELDEPAGFELERSSPAGDNGSKENLFVPESTSEEEELEPNEYAEQYSEYAEEQDEEELVYEEEEELIDDIDSVLLNQYGSDEEEEPLTDDNIPPGGEDEEEASDVDDTDLMRRLEEKYGKLPATGSAASPAATPTEGNDEEDEATAAGWTKIPSRAEEADRSYQEELRRAEQQLDENKPQEALAAFDRILLRTPNSIDALIGRARSLDALAEQRRSNAILTEAIAAYRKVIEHELSVDDGTLKTVAERCIDRMRFQGQHAQAIEVHNVLIRRFDNEPLYRNQLAVSYLYLNRLAEAKAVLHETLLRWIDNGFALVHYGFVLKTLDQNMELAAQYLQEGIETGHPGTQDGRFYFQLGDALQRLGRNSEARAVYRKGVQKKLFRSVYQRSLYNVDGLAARPYWTEEQTTYATELELIRAKWREVRDEGLKLLTSAGVFVNESENLRDRGDWKQLELFSRGARVERNCARAPYTCRLVEQYFPAARTCKRGQVKFSVMHPGTHVWPHCGPTNCRVRAHLGLRVPPGTYIRVAEETRSWENGKWLIFDDSFEHEVWHNGTETRLVLIVDFWHPELTESQRRTLSPI
ncbi:aspartyl/asparaginyl beta-hydroxylase isoform X2 [Anopheles gambiae]|uniref:aspartyl/asparaginyl beta-hydroxylase isoform X2 n=1 Tax=Anopheles gambiae TaxID=7165 RepID=UPI002AC8B63D|nr:aspartyl/asparaginyl beta-hydroxylase isoform X2 [Anopheles gambiae]